MARKKVEHTSQPALAQEVPLALIYEPDYAHRAQISDEAIISLAESFKSVGQTTAALLVPRNNYYEIVHGHRRYLAARKLGWTKMRAEVRTMTDEEMMLIRITENVEREGTTPYEDALFITAMVQKFKLRANVIAKRLGKSEAWVSQRLAILDWPSQLRDALKDKLISFSVARELARFENLGHLLAHLDYAIESGASPKTVARWVNDMANSVNMGNIEIAPADAPQFSPENEIPGQHCFWCQEHLPYHALKSIWSCLTCNEILSNLLLAHAANADQGQGGA